MPSQTYNSAGTYTWTAPTGVTHVQIECWGPGGNGGNCAILGGNGWGGGGGGGGGYAKVNALTVTPGNNYTVFVAGAGSGQQTTFQSTACIADFGVNGQNGVIGTPGSGGTGGTSNTGDSTISGSD